MEQQEQEKDLTTKLDELDEAYYKRFCKLKENFSLLPADQYEAMASDIKKQYDRDYKLLDGEQGINIDKQIEQLEKERAETLENLKLIREKAIEEMTTTREIELKKIEHAREKQLEELELEHTKAIKELNLERDKVLSDIEEQRFKQAQELDLQKTVAKAENDIKRETVVPQDLPRRRWQRYARPNYAKELVKRIAEIEIDNYYDKRESELAQLESTPESYIGDLLSALPEPRGKRAREKWQTEIDKLERKLLLLLPTTAATAAKSEETEEPQEPAPCSRRDERRRRKAAKAQLKQLERAADDKTTGEAIEEPQEPAAKPEEAD